MLSSRLQRNTYICNFIFSGGVRMKELELNKTFFLTLSKCTLFSHIPETAYHDLLQFMQASIKFYKKDEFLLHIGEPFLYAGVVLNGTVEGSFLSETFDKISMNHFKASSFFGEALACKQVPYSPIQLRAVTDCTVLFLDLHILLENHDVKDRFQQQFSINLIECLAVQNIFSNLKLRIMGQKSLRARIYLYLNSLIPDKDGWLQIPFSQTVLAEFLGVNRSALSRELGRMQDEGLIQINGKRIQLKNTASLSEQETLN
mgnify:FL=1